MEAWTGDAMLEYKEYIGLSIWLYNIGPHAHLVWEKDSVDNGPVSSGTQVRRDSKDQSAQTEQSAALRWLWFLVQQCQSRQFFS